MEFKHITFHLEDGVALVTLNRPDSLNAFTRVMRSELIQAFADADADDAVRAVVVTGAGRAFCAGMDLEAGGETFTYKDAEGKPVDLGQHRDGGGQVALAAHRCRKPIIAAINGPAVGVGLTITLAMDMRLAADDAKLGFVFSRRGIVTEACSSWFLPRLVGPGRAAELVLSGRIFYAGDPAATGLCNYVLPAAEVLPKALELAREIAENTSAVSVALCKDLLAHGLESVSPFDAHLAESRVFPWTGRQADAAEGIQAFLEKRPPRFAMSPTKDMPEFYPLAKDPD